MLTGLTKFTSGFRASFAFARITCFPGTVYDRKSACVIGIGFTRSFGKVFALRAGRADTIEANLIRACDVF